LAIRLSVAPPIVAVWPAAIWKADWQVTGNSEDWDYNFRPGPFAPRQLRGDQRVASRLQVGAADQVARSHEGLIAVPFRLCGPLGDQKRHALLVVQVRRPQAQLQFQLFEVDQEEQVRRYDGDQRVSRDSSLGPVCDRARSVGDRRQP
jgi:hypothetical protein